MKAIYIKLLQILYVGITLSLLFKGVNNAIYTGTITPPTFFYPEDYNDFDKIQYSSNEYFLNAYYFYDPVLAKAGTVGPKMYDYRNGVVYYPFSDVIN